MFHSSFDLSRIERLPFFALRETGKGSKFKRISQSQTLDVRHTATIAVDTSYSNFLINNIQYLLRVV